MAPLGFGPTAELLATPVAPEDMREAEERMRRYDSNRDGFLSKEEMSRFSGNPMDFDRNRDGKLSLEELAVRYARRRQVESDDRGRRDDRRDRREEKTVSIPDVFGGRKSYRTSDSSLKEGLPGWFADKDKNSDGQVSMAEYTNEWSEKLVEEFFAFDLSGDGVITQRECLDAINRGSQSTVASTSSSGSSSSDSSRSMGATSSTPSSSAPAEAPDERTLEYARKYIGKYDSNGDGVITAGEWEKMIINPAPADANRDGRITVEEYAIWIKSRSRR